MIKSSNAQENGESKIFNTNFPMYEFGDMINTQENVTSINLQLPKSSWNVTDININFTNIKLEREVAAIEDVLPDDLTYGRIYYNTPSKTRYCLGVQINLTESTIIYGAYLYGYVYPSTTEAIQVQIRGYDDVYNRPNSTIYHSQELNISNTPIWHIQNFTTPVSLPKGQFYLVLNGSGIDSNSSDFYWAYNGVDPINPSLYTSEYKSSWSSGVQNKPYLYKLIQKVDRMYYPEDINMSVSLNGDFFNVSNTGIEGEGNLTVSNLNFFPNSTLLNIPVHNDLSILLNYSLSYEISIYNIFNSQTSVIIEEGQDNQWNVIPEITRYTSNYSLKFHYPHNWYNLMVERDDTDISSQVEINQTYNYIFIPNDVITETANWKISANSLNINFGIDVLSAHLNVGQELELYLLDPIIHGNYTFELYNPVGYRKFSIAIEIPYEPGVFSVEIPLNFTQGGYKGFVYWFNGTDAGVKIQEFQINVPFTINPLLLLYIAIISGVAIAVSFSSYKVLKNAKRTREARKEEIYQKCEDILNLNYIMVVEKKSSLNVYEQVFTRKNVDATLISGFLEAIRSFGIELTSSDDETQTIKLEYKNSKILMSEFKDFRIILIMNDIPSQKFMDSIRLLSHEIENNYSKYLQEFKGNLDPFKDIENLLKQYLNTSFLYPLKIVKTGKVKITQIEKLMIGRASDAMKRSNLDYFYITHLMQEKAFDSKDIALIFELLDKKIFQPVL